MHRLIIAALLIYFFLLSGCDRGEEKSSQLPLSDRLAAHEYVPGEMKLPHFKLVSAVGDKTMSSSEFNDKVLLITFFASWCGSCRSGIDELKRVQAKFREQNFSVIAISEHQKDLYTLKKFTEKAKANYPILVGEKNTPQMFGGFSTVPVTFLVNRSGFVTKKYFGHLKYEVLIEDIEELILHTPTG